MYFVQTHDLAAGIADHLELADRDAEMLLDEVLHPGEDDIFEGLVFDEPLPVHRRGPRLAQGTDRRSSPRNASAQPGPKRRAFRRTD